MWKNDCAWIDDMFSAHKELMTEISIREKVAGIVPDPDVDTYMKVLYFYSDSFHSMFWSLAEFMKR